MSLRGDSLLRFSVVHEIEAVPSPGGWHVATRNYAYGVERERDGDASTPKTIIQFHHHPMPPDTQQPKGWVAYPHIHVETGLTPVTRKSHIPSGFVSLPSVVRFLIMQLGVAPLRADWEAVLDGGEQVLSVP